MTKRQRGSGSLYQDQGRAVWWCQYYANGQRVRESTKTPDRRKAERFLTGRLAELRLDCYTGPKADRVSFEDLLEFVRADYRLNGQRSASRVEHAAKRLATTFAGIKALRITPARLTAYAAERQRQGAALATIRYELAVLRRGFKLAEDAGSLSRGPKFPTLSVSNARQGFFEPAELEAVVAELPDHLQPAVRFAAFTGWRKAEVLGLTWDRVDFEAGVIRLDVGTTKNEDGRTFPMGSLPALAEMLAAEAATGKRGPLVFHRFGKPILRCDGAWAAACKRAGVAGRLFHDLRRTAVRNLERAGVSRSVAMKLTGHKTEAVYRRYAIVNEADLREGVAKLAKLASVSASIVTAGGNGAGEQAS